MRRPFAVYLFIVATLAILGGLSWLTRHPDAEILRRAESWPYVGSLAIWFREAYRQPTPTSPGPESPGVDPAGLAQRPSPAPQEPAERVWVLPGESLKKNRSLSAPSLFEFSRIAQVAKLEPRRGDWFHVRYRGREGWVLLEGYDEDAQVPYGNAPEPPRPLPPQPPDEERLAAALELLGEHPRAARLGPYAFYTDCRDQKLISFLYILATQLDRVYAERYGRRPLGSPREAVVLYRSEVTYRILQQGAERIGGLTPAGHNSRGLAVLFVGERTHHNIGETLVHELVHFLNRRAVGPHLPAWLDEGIADDLALSRLDDGSRLRPRELSGTRRRDGNRVTVDGGLSSLLKLHTALGNGELPSLQELLKRDWEGFVYPPGARLRYSNSAFWVRYLLHSDDGRRAAAFRGFLDSVAAGEPPDPEALRLRLEESWDELDRGFRAWVGDQARAADLGNPDR